MGAFERYRALKIPGSSFVTFCRLIDPSIPLPTKEYKRHKTYTALEYLKRKHQRGAGAGAGQRDARADWMGVAARILASVFGVVADKDRLWQHVQNEFVPVIGERRMTKLQSMVEQTQALVILKAKPITNANVEEVHVEHDQSVQDRAA